MKRSPLNAPGRRLVHGIEFLSRYAVELWCESNRAAPPVIVGLDSSEYDRGRARGHVEACELMLGCIRRGQFSPEAMGEVGGPQKHGSTEASA